MNFATIPEHMSLLCDSMTLATNYSSGRSSATIKIRTGITLDVTKASFPIGEYIDGVQIDGLSVRIGDLIEVSSKTCGNFPELLDDVPLNQKYPNSGFIGYVSNISVRADANQSVIDVALSDETWKWAQYIMLPLALNINDATKLITVNEIKQNGYTTLEILSLFEEILERQGYSKSNFIFTRTGFSDRVADPKVTSFTSSNVFQAFEELINNVYGNAVHIYSAGAGDMQLRKVETDENILRSITIDKNNIISNDIEIKSGDKKIETVIAFGDRVKYFVGDGKIDNEMVPDWDWWMDGYYLVIDKATGQPAMYKPEGSNGFIYVNPFWINIIINSNGTVKFGDPTNPSADSITFKYGDGLYNDDNYPSYTKYLGILATHIVSNYLFVRPYSMDAVLCEYENIQRPMHDARFKRWRLKNSQPNFMQENVHANVYSIGQTSVYYDSEMFPRRLNNVGMPKDYCGDPARLNERGATVFKNIVGGNETYTTLISPQFINSATHKIVQQRLKPGMLIDASSGNNDGYYEDIPNPYRQNEVIEETAAASSPIFLKYDLIVNNVKKANIGELSNPGSKTAYTAERIQVDGSLSPSNTGFLSNKIVLITTSTLDYSSFLNQNLPALPQNIGELKDSWRPFSGFETDNNEDYLVNDYFSPYLTDETGEIIGENAQKLKWYYPIKHGKVEAIEWIKRQNLYPILDKQLKTISYAQVPAALGIPRIELYGFVQYMDRPELESKEILSDIYSYYWQNIRSTLIYSKGNGSFNENSYVLTGENALFERQIGGYYDYDSSIYVGSHNERIAFYKGNQLGISTIFGIQNTSINVAGNYLIVLKFPLFNARARFEDIAKDYIHGRIPAGKVSYYERTDIRPELSGENIGIYSVSHNLSNGWTVEVTYGGGIPRLKDIFEQQERMGGVLRSVLAETSRNKTVNMIGSNRGRVFE